MKIAPLIALNVLDKGYVELLNMMPNPLQGMTPDQAVVNAARVSYLGESKGNQADKKLLFYLMRNEHWSPFEQVQLQFRIKMPIMVERQISRYRAFHVNAQSYRYTEVQADEFYIPDESMWRMQSESNKQGSEGYLPAAGHTTDGIDGIGCTSLLRSFISSATNFYSYMVENGVAKEQARLIIPAFALYTTWVITMDARNMMNFLKQRLDSHAQWEIREYAHAIDYIFAQYMPWTREAFREYVMVDNDASAE